MKLFQQLDVRELKLEDNFVSFKLNNLLQRLAMLDYLKSKFVNTFINWKIRMLRNSQAIISIQIHIPIHNLGML